MNHKKLCPINDDFMVSGCIGIDVSVTLYIIM